MVGIVKVAEAQLASGLAAAAEEPDTAEDAAAALASLWRANRQASSLVVGLSDGADSVGAAAAAAFLSLRALIVSRTLSRVFGLNTGFHASNRLCHKAAQFHLLALSCASNIQLSFALSLSVDSCLGVGANPPPYIP